MQTFWADFGYVGKINNKKFFKNFFCQCLALPKDRQSFCEVQKKCVQIFSKKFFYSIWIIQMFQKCKNFQKIPIGSGSNSRHKYAFSTKHAQKFHHPVVPQRMKKVDDYIFHPPLIGFFWKKNCVKSLHDLNQIILFRKSLKYILLIIQECPDGVIKSITMKPNILPKTLFQRFSPKFLKV